MIFTDCELEHGNLSEDWLLGNWVPQAIDREEGFFTFESDYEQASDDTDDSNTPIKPHKRPKKQSKQERRKKARNSGEAYESVSS